MFSRYFLWVFLHSDQRMNTHLIKHWGNTIFPLDIYMQALLWYWNLSRFFSFLLFNIMFNSIVNTFRTFPVKAFCFGYVWFNLWPTFCHVLNTIWLGLLIHIADCWARASRWCGSQGKAASVLSAGMD